MPSISSLYVDLSLQADNFINGLKDAQTEAKEMEKTLKPLKVAAEDLGKTFTIVGGLGLTAFAGMVKASSDYGETLNKVSIQTGITTEQLSALKYVAEQEETSFDALTVGLKKMSVTAVQNAAAFEGIGVQVKDASGQMRPMNDILLDAAKRFASMNDETKRTALEVEIFGRSGSDLNELLLRLGTEGLAPATQKVQELGLEMSGKTSHAADDFNDSIKEIEGAVLGLSNAVASALLPELTDTSHSLRDAIIAAKDFAKEHEGLTKAIGLTGAALTGTGGLLLGLAEIVSIYPKVVIGLKAIASGIGSITIAEAAATLGLTALAAELVYVISLYDDSKNLIASNLEQRKKDIQNTYDTADALKKLGIVVQQGIGTWDDYVSRVQAAALAHRNELKAAADAAKDAVNIEIHSKAEIIEAKKQQAAEFAAIEKDIADKAHVMAGIAKTQYEDFLKQESDAKKAQAEFLKNEDKLISDFQRSLWQVDTGLYDLELKKQKDLKKEQSSFMTDEGKKIEAFQRSVDQGLTGLNDLQVENAKKLAKEQQKAADQSAQAWKNAMQNLNTRLAESFADMVVNAKFNMSSLVNIAQTTAKSMLSAFLSGLMSPLTTALGGLGKSLSGALTGGGIGGGLGILGGLGGSGVSAGQTAALNAAGFTADAGTAGIGGLLGLSGIATLGIGAGVAAVAALAAHFIGQGRKTADEFVSQFQNPFGAQLAQVSASGTVSDLDQIWATFNQTAAQFASQGGNQAKVVSQAHATLDPLVAQIRSDLAAKAATTVNVTVQGNVMPGMTDQIVQGMLDALQTNQGGMVTALQDAIA